MIGADATKEFQLSKNSPFTKAFIILGFSIALVVGYFCLCLNKLLVLQFSIFLNHLLSDMVPFE